MKHIQLAEVDRGIFERLRLVLVEEGYLPDVTTVAEGDWEMAMQAIRQSGKEPITLYGVGAWKSRGEILTLAIIIERTGRELSSLGYDGSRSYVPNGSGFNVYQSPLETAILKYSITAVGQTQAHEYLLQNIMYQAFGVSKSLEGYTEAGSPTPERFVLQRGAISNQNDADFVETVFTYSTRELLLEPDTLIGTTAGIQQADFTIEQ
jgi:hypothetical protein